MRYIGVDLGTTHTKCGILDTESLTASSLRIAHAPPAADTSNGRYETDAEVYFAHVRDLLDTAIDDAPDVRGVFFSAQMHGCVVTDVSGIPLTGVISWQDAAGMREAGGGESYVDRLARVLSGHNGNPMFVRPARKQALGNLYARVENGLRFPPGSMFSTVGGYIALRLGGAHACHASMAASTGCATARGDGWCGPALDAAGLSSLRFPRIVTGCDAVGEYRRGGKEYALYPDVGDHQAGVLGSLARAYDDLHVNIGTGGMIGRIVRRFAFLQGVETRPLLDDWSVHTITGLPGGRHLRVVMDFLADALRFAGCEAHEEALWERAASIAQEGKSLSVDPSFFSPGGGRINGIGVDGLHFDALLRGMYRAVGNACAEAKGSLGGGERLVYTGGAVTRNAAMRHAIETACGLPGTLPRADDGAMTGLLRLALYSQGVSLEDSGEILSR